MGSDVNQSSNPAIFYVRRRPYNSLPKGDTKKSKSNNLCSWVRGQSPTNNKFFDFRFFCANFYIGRLLNVKKSWSWAMIHTEPFMRVAAGEMWWRYFFCCWSLIKFFFTALVPAKRKRSGDNSIEKVDFVYWFQRINKRNIFPPQNLFSFIVFYKQIFKNIYPPYFQNTPLFQNCFLFYFPADIENKPENKPGVNL